MHAAFDGSPEVRAKAERDTVVAMRSPFTHVTLAATSIALALHGCGGDASPTPSSSMDFNGCTDSAFVDRTAAGASRVVGFAGIGGSTTFGYAPKCMTIAVGQTVTFMGASSFGVHPLAPGTSPSNATAGSPNNPIPRLSDGSMTMTTVTFPAAGTFPYLCQAHFQAGMVGVIRVR